MNYGNSRKVYVPETFFPTHIFDVTPRNVSDAPNQQNERYCGSSGKRGLIKVCY